MRQLENELQMEEYLKQKLQDEAYQVQEAAAGPPPRQPRPSSTGSCLLNGGLPPSLFPTFPEYSGILSPRIPGTGVLNVSCRCLFFQILIWKEKGAFVTLEESRRLPIQTRQDCEERKVGFFSPLN